MSITRIGPVATLLAATLGATTASQAAERGSPATKSAAAPQGEQKTAFFGLFGCGTGCGYGGYGGYGCGYRACSPCISYGGCYSQPIYGSYGGCGPVYGGCNYYGSSVVTSPIYSVPSYGGLGYGAPYGYPSYGAPAYGTPGIGGPMYGPYGSRSTTPALPVVNRPEKFRSTAFEEDQNSPFYP